MRSTQVQCVGKSAQVRRLEQQANRYFSREPLFQGGNSAGRGFIGLATDGLIEASFE